MVVCSQCKFFQPSKFNNNNQNECRFDPPRVASHEAWTDRWPYVKDSDWCGKGQPNERD